MNEKQTPMMRTNEAVAGLNKVAGFDPVKLLQKSLSRKPVDKAEATRLELRYKKLWFRLAYPQGRIRVSAIRLTEQLAIIEAKIFLHKDDSEPVANFTAERTAQDSPLYIQAAQYEAQDNALTDAGFGIQLCDVCQAMGEEAYTPRQAAAVHSERDETVPAPAAQVETTLPAEKDKVKESAPDVLTKEPPVMSVDEPSVDPHAPVEGASSDETTPVQETTGLVTDGSTETGTVEEEHKESSVQVTEGGYLPSMPVEEIVTRMTLEEALSTIADVGMCRGQTLAQIADRRPASLRWYMLGCKEASNVLKAGAQLVLDSLAMPKGA